MSEEGIAQLGSVIQELEGITRVRANLFSKQLKSYYIRNQEVSGGNPNVPEKYYRVYYDLKEHVYGLTNIDPKELHISHVLIGKLSWEQVMRDTQRNNIRVGGEYIYDWVNEQLTTQQVTVNIIPKQKPKLIGEGYKQTVKQLTRTKGRLTLEVEGDKPNGLIHASLLE